jgi:NADH-quinone oxidoreductase subunit L
MILAIGAITAGFVGVPAALGGSNPIEHFLAPSFAAPNRAETGHVAAGEGGHQIVEAAHNPEGGTSPAEATAHQTTGSEGGQLEAANHDAAAEGVHLSRGAELGLMLFSVLVAVGGIWLARRFYLEQPAIPERLAERYPVAYRTLLNKYYVDELYDATVISGTIGSARGLWRVDSGVVDGAVNGSGLVTRVTAFFSGLFDRYVVDGLVNLVGWVTGESSFVTRKLQTGLIQNYAFLMLFGVFAFLAIYLIAG